MISVPVRLGARSYDVVIGDGAKDELASMVPEGAQKAAVITQQAVGVEVDPGVAFDVIELPDGEQAKSMQSVEQVCRRLAASGLARSDVLVSVGGGVVSDVAGFAASIYLRGIRYVNVATTLLAQVDAAIGGKTGVNLAEGKNLVGTFWQPSAVLCDTSTLGTLPPRQWISGRGEIAKCAIIAPSVMPDLDLTDLAVRAIDEQVAACVAIKAEVVAGDEREAERRMILNYGHTLAHSLEASALSGHAAWDIAHGEAVAIGMAFAANLAHRLGRVDASRVEWQLKVIRSFDLDTDLPRGASAAGLVEFMGRDKKARHDLTFVLDGPNGIQPVRGVREQDVVQALIDMGSRP